MTTKNERTRRLLVLLDSGPRGLLSHPKARSDANDCKAWLTALLAAGHAVVIPEITYYETRRELRRVEMKNGTPSAGLANMETLAADMGVVPLTSAEIRLETEFRAEARNKNFAGRPISRSTVTSSCAPKRGLLIPGTGRRQARKS